MMNLVGISGSLRKASTNTGLLRAAQALLPEGVSLTIADLSNIPLYNEDVEQAGEPEAVAALRKQLVEADGILIASPEYNYSLSGVLKNAIDWMSRTPVKPFNGKPVAIMGASGGNFGTVRGQIALRTVLQSQNALTLSRPEVLVTQGRTKADEAGTLIDEASLKVLGALIEALVLHVRRTQATKELS